MRTHKVLCFMAALLFAAVPFFAEDKVVASQWTAKPLHPDGQTADWGQSALIQSKSENVSYAFSNDASYIYLLFVFNESKTTSSVGLTGMTFWVNPEGKEKKTHGLRFYQKVLSGPQLVQQMESQGDFLPEDKKAEILASKKPFILSWYDAVNKKGEVVPLATRPPATFRVKKEGKDTVFKYLIPLALLKDPASKTPFDAAKPFKLGFEWGGATPEMMKDQVAALGEMGVRAGGERGGNLETQVRGEESGEFTASSPDMSNMRRRLPKKYDFWVTLQVAQKQ